MKKLLFLINLLLSIFFLFSCINNKPNQRTDSKAVINTNTIEYSSFPLESTKNNILDSSSKSSVIKIDTTTKDYKYRNHNNKPFEAPKHNAPDQDKIDSIKKSKEKLK